MSPPKSTFEFPSSSFFGILFDSTAYRSLAYLFLLFPISIGLFVYSITMVSLSLGLAITIFGLPLAYVFLLSLPLLNRIQAGMAEVILDVPMPHVPFPSPDGGFLDRLVSLTKNFQVQSALVLSIFLFPLATVFFILEIVSLSVSVSLMLVILYPLVRLILENYGVDVDDEIVVGPIFDAVPEIVILGTFSIVGFFLFILSLHMLRFFAYTHARFVHYSLS